MRGKHRRIGVAATGVLLLAAAAIVVVRASAGGSGRDATPAPTATQAVTASSTPEPLQTATASPTATPTVEPTPALAPRVILAPFGHEWQTWNNCGPATLASALRYFGVERTQEQVAAALKPHPDDKNVELAELVRYAESAGVRGRVVYDGDLETLYRLLNAGIPVITETWLRVGEDIGHYRLVNGYDLSAGTLLTQDSYHGPNVWVSADDFLAMWQPFLYVYIPLYRPADEPLAASAVGPAWERSKMIARALAGAENETVSAPLNPYAWYNLGDARFLANDMEGAVVAYERAVAAGLPRRFFWYHFHFFTALNATGRHERVLELTAAVLAYEPALAEVLIERGHALRALGRNEEAAAAYQRSLEYAPDRDDVRRALAELGR